jgi:predicted nicotinamide N-methyase
MEIEAVRRESGRGFAAAGELDHGPTVHTVLRFGAETITLARPSDPDRLLDDPAVLDWNRRDDYMPYWAYVWPGAYLLAERVAREPWRLEDAGVAGRPALEIGCGLGLAGLVAVKRGLFVHFTDYDPAPLEFVARSAALNGFDPGRYSRGLLDWRALPAQRYEIILGADVIYEARLVGLVANLLAELLAPAGLALIASPYRVAAERFPAALEKLGLTSTAEPVSAQTDDGRRCDGTIYRVTRIGATAAGPFRRESWQVDSAAQPSPD